MAVKCMLEANGKVCVLLHLMLYFMQTEIDAGVNAWQKYAQNSAKPFQIKHSE